MQLGHIEILTTDLARSRHFYCDVLGFEITVIQDNQYVWLRKGALEVLLRPGRPRQVPSRYEDGTIGFVLYSDNLPEDLDHLTQQGVAIKGTVDSDTCYTFIDPDGNWFQLVDPAEH